MLLAQLTDTHIKAGYRLAYGIVDTAAFLRAAVARLNAHRPRVDAVIVTGDLTDRGSAEEFQALRDLLDDLDMPWFAVPGNHDRRAAMIAAFTDQPYLKGDDGFVHYAIEDYPFRLIGLDTTVPGQPHGHLCPVRLDWLARRLAERPDVPTLIFQHHPPFATGIEHMDVQNLRNGEALMALLAGHRQVRHVACGHVHRAIETVLHGIGVSIAPNAAHTVALDLSPAPLPAFTLEPPSLRLFLLDERNGMVVSHLLPVEPAPGPYPFFDSRGDLLD